MTKTLVIFDIDGTLVYSDKIDSQCFAATYQQIYGFEFPTIDWTKYPHVTDTTIFKTVIHQHFGRKADVAEMVEFQHEYVAMLEEKRRVQPADFREVAHARMVVERLLADERFVVGIGTGGWRRPARVKLAHVQIPVQSLVLVGADGHEQRESIITQVMDEVAQTTAVSRTVYVGDAIWDVETTRRMGMNFIGIRKDGDFEVLRNAGSGVVLKDFSNFEVFLEAIFEAEPPKKMV